MSIINIIKTLYLWIKQSQAAKEKTKSTPLADSVLAWRRTILTIGELAHLICSMTQV